MLIARGTVKPPFGARVNPAHPFARGLLLAVPFNCPVEVNGSFPDLRRLVLWGSVAPRTCQIGLAPTTVSTNEGLAFQGNTSGGASGALQLGADFVAATGATFCLIALKKTSSLPTQITFGMDTGGNTNHCACGVPWSDGTVYWDFGGNSGANRLAVSGLTFNTGIADRWVFTAGPSGMQMWQNGKRVGNQTTAVTRVVNTANAVSLWPTFGPAANYPINYFAAYDHQWDEAMCRWWSSEPYAHLYRSRIQSLPNAAAAGGAPAASALPVFIHHYREMGIM